MFPSQQYAGDGPSSRVAPRVHPALHRNNAVIWPTASYSTAPGKIPGAPGRHLIRLPKKPFKPAAEQLITDVAGIAALPSLPDICYDKYDEFYVSDDSSDFGRAKGKAPISLKQMEFSFKQFAKRMGQPNFCAFNK